MPLTITVRQTVDPYHDVADVQYIAQSTVTLPENGCLDCSQLGVGKPGDLFAAKTGVIGVLFPLQHTNTFYPSNLRDALYHEADSDPILIVVERSDYRAAQKRHFERIIAQEKAEEIENLKRPFIQAWNYLASSFSCGATSDYDEAGKRISFSNSNNRSLSSPPSNQLREKVVPPIPKVVSNVAMTSVRRRRRGSRDLEL